MKIEKLTKEQEAQMSVIKNKWIKKVFNYELHNKINFESVKKQMKELYSFSKLNEPKISRINRKTFRDWNS